MLHRFTTACHSHPHILAATLNGSHATGTADEWSDIDLGVIVADDAYDDFVAGREAFIRQLGEPLFIEDFDIPGIVFFILAGGAEGEMTIERESDFVAPYGVWQVLVDKTGIFENRNGASARSPVSKDEQVEVLRRQIVWFWHDLSHFITAMARGQLWWAAGQLEILRRYCLILARLTYDMADADAADDPTFKLDKLPIVDSLSPLAKTFVSLEREAMLAAAEIIIDYFRATAQPLAQAHGLGYPIQLERLMLDRLARAAARGTS